MWKHANVQIIHLTVADNLASSQLNASQALSILKELIYTLSHFQIFTFVCGGYRSRTDDPLRARQML